VNNLGSVLAIALRGASLLEGRIMFADAPAVPPRAPSAPAPVPAADDTRAEGVAEIDI
jgi:hypothetical protein